MTDDDDKGSTGPGSRQAMLALLYELLEGFANPTASRTTVLSAEGSLPVPWVAADVDVGSLAAWALAGLQLFSGDLPTSREVVKVARRIVLLAALARYDGNITRMAEALETSRRALRDQLKAADLYTLRGPSHRPPTRGGE
ncbi:MAG: hypothetical protein KDK70_24940 [Myxococcales bacterium]|nr:hypothetical protein [Myxococcales bacterium]